MILPDIRMVSEHLLSPFALRSQFADALSHSLADVFRHLLRVEFRRQNPIAYRPYIPISEALRIGGIVGTRRQYWKGSFTILICLGALAWPAIHFYRQHQREAQQEAENRSRDLASLAELESALGRLKGRWRADEWETGQKGPAYTIDLRRTIATGNPLIFYGNVEDIQESRGEEPPIIEVKVHTSGGSLHLRLSLSASRDQADSILKEPAYRPYVVDELSKVCIFVATIENIRRIETTSSQGTQINSYVASGTLLDEFASQVYADSFLR